jgi:hypothetical protein
MVTAGWFYDPAPDTPDAVTCAYCTLSLDSWDAGDDPAQEHLKRAPDCLFFSLKDLYHPPTPPPALARPKKTAKRTSSRAKPTTTTTNKRAPAPAPRSSPPPSVQLSQKHKSVTPEPNNKSDSSIEHSEISQDIVSDESIPEPSRKRKSMDIIPDKSTPEPSKRRKSDIPDKSTPEPSKGRKSDISDKSTPELSKRRKSDLPDKSTPEPTKKHESEAIIQNTEAIVPPVKKAKLFGDDHTLAPAELDMTVEQWIVYNAEQAAQHLRAELEEQVGELDRQGQLALEAIDAIPVY